MIRKILVSALVAITLLACISLSAQAQSNVIVVPNPLGPKNPPTAVTVTNSSAAAVSAGNYGFVEIENQSASVTIYCIWGSAATDSATAGQYTLPALAGYVWDSSNPPPSGQALNCIAASSVPATVRAY